jgi:nitrite reductase/ring-hydroxylating ferredoxin subunit
MKAPKRLKAPFCSRRLMLKKLGLLSFFWPLAINSACKTQPRKPRGPIILGPVDSFQLGLNELDLFRVRIFHSKMGSSKSFRAISMVCTHEVCIVKRAPNNSGYICPCHEAAFSETGAPLSGPVFEPLPWYKLSVSEQGDLLLWPDQRVDSNWALVI